MKEASWKGELVDEVGGVGDNRHRKTPKVAGLQDRWRVWPSSEVTFAVALGGKEQSRAPCGETCRSGGRKWKQFRSEDFYFFCAVGSEVCW